MRQIKKTKADTIAAQVKAHAAVKTKIEPPAMCRMRDVDLPHWKSIIAAKQPDEWTEPDLFMAAQMARSMADIELIDAELLTEPRVINNKPNPKITIVETLTNRVMRISRSLQINARAKNGEIRDLKRGRENHYSAMSLNSNGQIIEYDEDGYESLI